MTDSGSVDYILSSRFPVRQHEIRIIIHRGDQLNSRLLTENCCEL